jgi:MFS family permease
MVPLSFAQGLSSGGDAFVTVSLAGSRVFNISPDASREQVLLYLVITMVPLAVLAPLIGPTVDRFRHIQRFVAAGFMGFRALCCLALVATLLELAFYPIALALLVASKASWVVKQTLLQGLVDDPDELVGANARLARFSSITAAVAAVAAVALLNSAAAEWTLRAGAVLYVAAAVVVLFVRPRHAEAVAKELEYEETHAPAVFVSSIGMIAIRAAVGFFIFTLAFSLRRDSEPAWVYGLAVTCYAVGAFIGHTAATLLRGRLREQQLIAVAIAAPAMFTTVGILGVSIPLLMLIAALVGLSTTLGRNAFDGLLQRLAPEALLGRAGARYETAFQLAWVFGGILATPISLPIEVSMTVLTLIYVPSLLLFVRASRVARHHDEVSTEPEGAAVQRLMSARRAWEVGHGRVAIIDAASAVDLAALMASPAGEFAVDDGGRGEGVDRSWLDNLRRRATDPYAVVADADVARALAVAGRLVSPPERP